LALVENTAHMCHYEKPDLWAQHVGDFLTRR
jgi:pimeloyl-ACP methyl ester carboxylesterase